MTRVIFLPLILALLVVSGCSRAPACAGEGGSFGAPSAGCLVVDRGDVLLVQIFEGTYGPPGGSVDSAESAQCAAERETWEETGVAVKATDLAAKFDNGFHLYWCDVVGSREVSLGRPLEIKSADWYAPDDFSSLSWRFEGQGNTIVSLILDKTL